MRRSKRYCYPVRLQNTKRRARRAEPSHWLFLIEASRSHKNRMQGKGRGCAPCRLSWAMRVPRESGRAISGCRSKGSGVRAKHCGYLNRQVCTKGWLKRAGRVEDGGAVAGTGAGRCLASTEIKNIDSHSHAGLHRSSIRFSPARQYLFFPRTVRGTNCSCIPRSLSVPRLSLRRNPKHKGSFSFGFSSPALPLLVTPSSPSLL